MIRLYFILFICIVYNARAFEIQLDPNYKMAWRVINNNKIEFTLSLLIKEGSGFVGLGFLTKDRSPLEHPMKNSDLAIATILEGKITSFDDYWGSGPGIIDDDESLGGVDNYKEYIWRKTATTTTLIFNRTLNTEDKVADIVIHLNGTSHIIWSYNLGSSDQLMYHGPKTRGQILVGLQSGSVQQLGNSLTYTLRVSHGALMTFSWGFATVAAVIVARYCRTYWWWRIAHRIIQALNTLLTIPFFILSTVTITNHISSTHAALGLAVVILSGVQSLLGVTFSFFELSFVMKRIVGDRLPWYLGIYKKYNRLVFNYQDYIVMMHKNLGRVLALFAIGVIASGLLQLGEGVHGQLFWVYFVYIGVLVALFLMLETRFQYKRWKRHWTKIDVE